jgi:predicted ester cyclase
MKGIQSMGSIATRAVAPDLTVGGHSMTKGGQRRASGRAHLSLEMVGTPSARAFATRWLCPPYEFLIRPSGRRIGAIAVIETDLSDVYRNYIACLNKQDWPKLGQFVDDEAVHNGRRVGLSGYRDMLVRDFDEIPDLYFNIQMLISDPPYIASRLGFDCTPKGTFLGLPINGKRVSFTENVFYEFRSEKIREVWSVIDKAAIEAQL